VVTTATKKQPQSETLPPSTPLPEPVYDLFPTGIKLNGIKVKDDIHSPLSGKELNMLVHQAVSLIAVTAEAAKRDMACKILRVLEEVMTSRDLRKALDAETANGVKHSPEVAEALSRLARKEESKLIVS
jgi:hypothetical protein